MDAKHRLAHILWIGGATDCGKSTVARNLGERFGIAVFNYDRADAGQLEKLAGTIPEAAQFLNASMEERWILQTPERMFDFLLLVFPYRFGLTIESLLEMSTEKPVIVEGFGLLPELVQPLLSSPYQAIWFVPTETFKWNSMLRRGKPSFASAVSDPEKVRMNLYTRDMMLAKYYQKQVSAYGYKLVEVNGSRSVDEMTDLVESHFAKYMPKLSK